VIDIDDTIRADSIDSSATAAASSALTIAQLRQAIELALQLGDPDAAAHGARVLLDLFPEAIAPMALLGHALLDLGQYHAAIKQLHAALSRNPLDAQAWAALAGALSLAGAHGPARAALYRAALHDPLESELLTPGVTAVPANGIGVGYLRRGHASLAVPELAATLERHPERDDLRIYYIEALRRSGDLAAARAQFSALGSAEPPTIPSLLLRAALAPSAGERRPIQQQCARYDIDGRITRRFFAPDPPPWPLAAAPILPSSDAFAPLARYLAHRPDSPKAVAKAMGEQALQYQPQDTDVRTFVATTERLWSRLSDRGGPRPLVPTNVTTRQAQLLLGCKAVLLKRYGPAGFAAIDARLHAISEALQHRQIQAYCCYIDDPASLQIDEWITLAPAAHDASAIRNLIRVLAEALGQHRQELGTVLLIGGDDSIPFHRVTNPLHDDDAVVLSDSPYGSDDAGYMLPQRVVARLPDGAGDQPELLLRLLDQMLDYHRGRSMQLKNGFFHLPLLGGRRNPARKQSSPVDAGYSAEVWRAASRLALDTLDAGAPLSCCPPLDTETIDLAEWSNRRILYVNLHGASGLPNWYGQPDLLWPGPATQLPIALRPEQLADRWPAGALLISEACYGAELVDRTEQSSIMLKALAEGALACVGSTVSSYGSLIMPLIGADLLSQKLLGHLASGLPVGAALHQARLEFAQTMYRRQGYLDDVDVKTLVEFVLLGDPWAAVEASNRAPAQWPVTKIAGIERVPKPRPKSVIDEAQVPQDLLNRARTALRRALPSAAATPLYITSQPEPRLARKSNGPATNGQELVFSAQNHQHTIDGHQIAQTAHVTVNQRAVVKLAVSR
jgi:tetratricopeptide (TPR) repeat protein